MCAVMENDSVIAVHIIVVLPYIYLQELLSIIASVLHLGNVQYGSEDGGNAYVTVDTQIKYLSRVSIQPHYTLLSLLQNLMNSITSV